MSAIALFVAGLVTLIAGAEALVRGGAGLAARLGISPMIIGATIIALGTSAPELAIGIDAAIRGSGSLAIGNIAGTNTVNLLLILGVTALAQPLPLRSQVIRLDLPMIVLASALLLVFALDGRYTIFDGVALITVGLVYTTFIVRAARRETMDSRQRQRDHEPTGQPTRGDSRGRLLLQLLGLLAGIVAVVVGAGWLVDGAVEIALALGVSEGLIGLTIVALGTSAPELVTAVVATVRRQREIALGNLLGSSVYNIVLIFAITVLVTQDGIAVDPVLVMIDLPVMLLAAIACIPVFLTGRRIGRVEGAMFVGAYLAYLASLILLRT